MSAGDRYQSLPIRLRRALWIWLALTPLTAALPSAGWQAVGVLSHPAFWCGLLPILALAPHIRQLLPPPSAALKRSRRAAGQAQARRRPRGQRVGRMVA